MKWQEIFWFLIPGVIQWPFRGPWGVKYYSTETQKMAIFLWNWYKTGQNVTLTIPQTYFWAFYTWNGGNCLRFDTRAHLLAFLWPPESQILPHKDSKEVYFRGKSIQNLVKMSPRLSPRLTFEHFTHENSENCFRFDTRGSSVGLSMAPRRSNITLWRLKRSPFSKKIDNKSG